nr:DegT/DnrJ/EryC1/StrS family aminotransferase [uncultured Blautia sp.]
MIPLMNTSRQYVSIQEELDAKVLSILHSGQYIMGKEVTSFEAEFAEYIGTKYAIGVGNGTDALVIALMAAGVGEGDEVITTAMSFFSTAEAIAVVGAKPVFADCTADTYTLDPLKIEEKVTVRTKAIMPVHIYGQCVEMEAVNVIAKKYGLVVIEDAAQAAGAVYKGKKAGSLGDIGCVSFFPTKNLGCAGDGGIIVTNKEDFYKKCAAYRVHGSGDNGKYAYCKLKGIRYDDTDFDYQGHLPKYFNYVIGFNSRLDALQAGILRVKLQYLDKWNERRRAYAEEYDHKIQNPLVIKPVCSSACKHIYYVYVICVEERERFRRHMETRGIDTGVYFPIPLHLQQVFVNLGYKKGDMPNAEYLGDHGVALPMFPEMTDSERQVVIEAVNQFE